MCSPKTMVKIGAVLAVPMVGFYIFLPEFRGTIAGLLPLALLAICPLSMLFGMKMMGKDGKSCTSCNHDHAQPATMKETAIPTEKL